MPKNIPITLVTGYLGSGKTTLLNHILANRSDLRAAIIVNDIGEMNIDASLIAKGAGVELGRDIVPMTNGCICCTLQKDLVTQVLSLCASEAFDCILIEASGICEPLPIAQALSFGNPALPSACHVSSIVTVVDAMRLADEYLDGEYLLGELEEDDVAGLIIEQLEFCSSVVINKASAVSPEDLARIRAVVRHIQPEAPIIEADFGAVQPGEIIGTNAFGFARTTSSAGWIRALRKSHSILPYAPEASRLPISSDAPGTSSPLAAMDSPHLQHPHHSHGEGHGIGTFVYMRSSGFNRERLEALLENAWPQGIIRCKGFLWFSDEPEISYLFEQAGRQVRLSLFGQWKTASCPASISLTEPSARLESPLDECAADQRAIRLVFIGRNLDSAAISTLLDSCLMHS